LLDRRGTPGGLALSQSRIIRAGIVAGLVFVAGGLGLYFVLGRVFPDVMDRALGDTRIGGRDVAVNAGIRLLLGWITVWLYAAARFRLRSTFRTAVRVGLAVWFIAYVPQVWIQGKLGVFPWTLLGVILAWGFVETLAAAIIGGFLHQRTKPDGARY